MPNHKWVALALIPLALVGCAELTELGKKIPINGNQTSHAGKAASFGADEMLDYMEQIARFDAAELGAEQKRLHAKASRTPVERLKLGMILSRDGVGPEELARAQELLAGLDGAFADNATRLLIQQLQRVVTLELTLRQEKKKSTELQDKIEKLKTLEQKLQEQSLQKPGPAAR